MAETEPTHETNDAPARIPLRVIVFMVMFVPLVLALIGGLLHTLWAPSPDVATPFVGEAMPTASGPRLQSSPQTDLADFEARMTRELTHYGWIDQENRIVSLPIDEAMALLVERGLPEVQGTVPDQRTPPNPDPDAATEWLRPPDDRGQRGEGP